MRCILLQNFIFILINKSNVRKKKHRDNLYLCHCWSFCKTFFHSSSLSERVSVIWINEQTKPPPHTSSVSWYTILIVLISMVKYTCKRCVWGLIINYLVLLKKRKRSSFVYVWRKIKTSIEQNTEEHIKRGTIQRSLICLPNRCEEYGERPQPHTPSFSSHSTFRSNESGD